MEITLTAAVAVFIVGTLIPMVTALVAKRYATSKFKDAVTIALSVVSGVVAPLVANGGSFELWPTLVTALFTYITAVGTHYRLLNASHLGITGRDGFLQRAFPGGLGSEY